MPIPLTPLAKTSKFTLIISNEKKIYFCYEKGFTSTPNWVEYDRESAQIYFVYHDGTVHDLGVKLDLSLRSYIGSQVSIFLVQIEAGLEKSKEEIPFVIRA